jgi:hypothetical protein
MRSMPDINPRGLEIYDLLETIINIWWQYPQLRLMQLLLNAIGVYTDFSGKEVMDHYNTLDAVVLQKLKDLYGKPND